DVKNFVRISVKDNGKGIDTRIQPKLFEKFTTMSDSGIGLGLFISKKIISAHGGSISGKNNENARGATFSFTLPNSIAKK
ncbi:MAG TPA: HAMP domain-containing sensor histidine kinase, partial [Nitrososphaeraceae archaeon]|nr:HAMP domain-containing sensor histidine kinase [Nitrososphaeraceae archaeon]